MTFEPLFLDGREGPVFAIYFPPEEQGAEGQERNPDEPAWGVAYLPPFAEEMNQSRRMATRQARDLAAAGVGVLLLDPFGTGDSGGDFLQARWDTWLADVDPALAFLEARGLRPALWGLRLGGLLAAQAAAARPDRVHRLVLWHPVTDGQVFLTQFLRLRVAAGLADAEAGETTAGLKQRLAEEGTLEVAGYQLPAALAEEIATAKLVPLAPTCPVHWFEMVSGGEAEAAPGARRTVEAWRAAGVSVELATVVGERFWSIQEPVMVPALWAATRACWSEASP